MHIVLDESDHRADGPESAHEIGPLARRAILATGRFASCPQLADTVLDDFLPNEVSGPALDAIGPAKAGQLSPFFTS